MPTEDIERVQREWETLVQERATIERYLMSSEPKSYNDIHFSQKKLRTVINKIKKLEKKLEQQIG